jgi:hypothetical protein
MFFIALLPITNAYSAILLPCFSAFNVSISLRRWCIFEALIVSFK